jgi:Rieske Fe-S protein
MITRKEFLRHLTGTAGLVALTPLASLLDSCATSFHVATALLRGNTVVVPSAGLPDFTQKNVYAKVFVEGRIKPFYFFRSPEGKMYAMDSNCSHRGCEVNKTRKGFECPCHGSEYDLNGNVVRGPAPEPLEKYDVEMSGTDFIFQLSPGT